MNQAKDISVKSTVNGEHSAIMVIHGIGEQVPFETLDMFTRGILASLNDRAKSQGTKTYIPIHRQRTCMIPGSTETWLENCISLEAENSPRIDIYEYYWAHEMTRQVTVKDIVKWMKDISSYAKKYYGENPKKDFEKKYKEEPHLRNLFEPSGQFHKSGYLRVMGIGVRALLFGLALLESSALRSWPLIQWVFNLLMAKAKKVFIDYIGDVVAYTATDRKAHLFKVRQSILRNSRLMLESILKNNEYGSVIVASHSLGTVVGYDTLNRIHKLPKKENYFDKIKGFITFGSPLDKIAFYFREHIAEDAKIRLQMINNLHSFKKVEMKYPGIDIDASDSLKVVDNTSNNLESVRWINFFDSNDPVGGNLDLYNVEENHKLDMKEPFGVTHIKYWEHPPMYKKILDFFSSELS
jgi:hypothetical protein